MCDEAQRTLAAGHDAHQCSMLPSHSAMHPAAPSLPAARPHLHIGPQLRLSALVQLQRAAHAAVCKPRTNLTTCVRILWRCAPCVATLQQRQAAAHGCRAAAWLPPRSSHRRLLVQAALPPSVPVSPSPQSNSFAWYLLSPALALKHQGRSTWGAPSNSAGAQQQPLLSHSPCVMPA